MKKPRFVIAAGVLALGLGLTACSNGDVAPLPPAPAVSVLPTTTTFPDYSHVSLPGVAGKTTTTTVATSGGTATISGKVMLNGAPTGGVDVHVDRFVGDATGGADVMSGNDGSFSFTNLLGGRYRVRAFRAPDATLANPITFFLAAGQTQTENLNLAQFTAQLTVRGNIAPNPPRLGDVANVVVQVTTQGVDNSGTAKSIGQPNLAVTLVAPAGQTIITPNPTLTAASGSAVWTIRCDALGAGGMTAILPDGSQTTLNIPACSLPPTTTTAPPVAPATTVAP